jgi:hypothetical protein
MFDRTMVRGLMALALAATAIAGTAMAQVVPPKGLAPGSQYEIVFATYDTTFGTSSNIADYNNFATQEAALSSSLPASVAWKAIASTPTINAVNNAPSYASVPIYNTAGQLVASGSAQLWSGVLANPIDYDQYGGIAPNDLTWTGTEPNGFGDTGYCLGQSSPLDDSGLFYSPIEGETNLANSGWVNQSVQVSASPSDFSKESLYALSSPITVTPEPSTFALLGAGAIGLIAYVWRRRAKA